MSYGRDGDCKRPAAAAKIEPTMPMLCGMAEFRRNKGIYASISCGWGSFGGIEAYLPLFRMMAGDPAEASKIRKKAAPPKEQLPRKAIRLQ